MDFGQKLFAGPKENNPWMKNKYVNKIYLWFVRRKEIKWKHNSICLFWDPIFLTSKESSVFGHKNGSEVAGNI